MFIPWVSHSTKKACGPATALSFAGIELHSVSFEARLPLEKLDKCLSLISDFLTRKKVTLKEIQSLTSMLNFAWFGLSQVELFCGG